MLGDPDAPGWVKAASLVCLAASVLQRRSPDGWPLLAGSLGLLAVGNLFTSSSLQLAALAFIGAYLLVTILFLQHIRRRRWLLPLGLSALGYALAAIAFLLLADWPAWVPQGFVYLGFMGGAVASAFLSRFAWAGFGLTMSSLGPMLAMTRIRDWPGPEILDHVSWILAFSGLAIMVAGVVQGPLKSKNHG
jgi:hypothetical protein